MLVLNTIVTQPLRAAAGLAAVLAGTPAFYVVARALARRASNLTS